MQSVRRMAKAKIITREEVASELGKWGPGLSLCCDECGGKGMEAVAEFAFKGQYHHHVCLVCLDVARARLLTILQALESVKTCEKPFGPAGDGAPDTIPLENSH